MAQVKTLYDLVVVGAGPAGLMAAKTAAENGLKVALLERKTGIPKIRRVDGGGIGVNEYLLGQMVLFNAKAHRLCFPVCGFSIPYDGPYANIYGFQVYSPGGKRILLGNWEEAQKKGDEVRVGIFLDKEILLRRLLEECRDCGAEIFPGANVSDLKREDTVVQLTANGEVFEGTFVVAADGINSRIARILKFNKERKFLGTERCITWVMEGTVPVDPGSFNFVITEKGTFSVATSFREGLFHITYLTFDPNVDLNHRIEYFVTQDPTYASWFTHAHKVEVTSCVVNHLSHLKEPFRDNVLLIGDAAWIMEFSNMAALCSGWKAGHVITLAITDGKIGREGMVSYLEWWKKNFYGLRGEYDFGLGAGDLQDYLSGEELDYLAGLVKEPFPATMNFFTLFNQIGETYGNLFPTIEQERPEIMGKLLEMRAQMEEVRKKTIKAGFANR